MLIFARRLLNAEKSRAKTNRAFTVDKSGVN